ncbi:MAG TPA: hypothetical protein VLV31_09360, partial [Candidatus Acidoferrales bacterium]|nr:hypothetical protein [Candidatus Acidoferrales bacterium]
MEKPIGETRLVMGPKENSMSAFALLHGAGMGLEEANSRACYTRTYLWNSDTTGNGRTLSLVHFLSSFRVLSIHSNV